VSRLPGALPVLNGRAVELAPRRARHRLHGERHLGLRAQELFYPDLPKGIQISQFDRPLADDGSIVIGERSIGVTRVHMEEDAGKSIHDRFAGATAIDLNRAGYPARRDRERARDRSSREATAYLTALRQILEYVRVSDLSMEEGAFAWTPTSARDAR
jgi:aspartyl-tRNA(Asn)/glutamyl-tRNA(Gln) amidotransferase subunit B